MALKSKKPTYKELVEIIQEVNAWKNCDSVQGVFTMAWLHGSRVSPEFSKKIDTLNNKIKNVVKVFGKAESKFNFDV